jgi:hypothetical protein
MVTKISPEVHARARLAAENLKKQLEARLIGQPAHAWGCACGGCRVGPSRIVGVEIPRTYADQIAEWLMWSCSMKDDHGKSWSGSISSYIPWRELYPLFRNSFAGIDVKVNHPRARIERDCDGKRDPASRDVRVFNASDRFVTVRNNAPVFVRPIGDPTNSVWLNAELRCDSNLENFVIKEPLISCNVDPFEFGQRRGRGVGPCYELTAPSEQSTFYIWITGAGQEPDSYFPIARLIAASKATGEATFVLDQSVESFEPVD